MEQNHKIFGYFQLSETFRSESALGENIRHEDDIETQFWAQERFKNLERTESCEFFSVQKTTVQHNIFTVFPLYRFREFTHSEIFLKELALGQNTKVREDIKPEILAQEPFRNVDLVRSYEFSSIHITVDQRNRNSRNK